MRLLLYVLIVLLWSSFSTANEAKINVNELIQSDAFTPISNEFNNEDSSKTVIVKNMPRIRSQDSFNTCHGCSSATIAQKYICDQHPDYVGRDCSKLPLDMEVSQMDLVSKSLTNKDGQSKDLPSNHSNIRLKSEDRKKTEGVLALLTSQAKFQFNSEQCFPFDQLVEKHSRSTSEIIENYLRKLEDYYITKKTEGDSNCTECLADVNQGLNSDVTQDQFNLALKKNTFGEFLYSLVFNKACAKKISLSEPPKIGIFPKNEPSEKSDLLGKLKEALGTAQQNRPVLLGNVCLYTDKTSKECLTHSLVISGYKLICADKEKKNCKQALKVHNCWGKDWQDKNNDGWVDAELLLANVNKSLPKLNDGAISWLY